LHRLKVCGRQPSTEIAAPAKQSSPHHWKFSKAHTGSRTAPGFQTSVYILYNKIMQATSRSHTKSRPSPKASRSISRVSVADLQSFMQNLMQTRCSILPSIADKTKHEVEKAIVQEQCLFTARYNAAD
jgi:hypothetical protein